MMIGLGEEHEEAHLYLFAHLGGLCAADNSLKASNTSESNLHGERGTEETEILLICRRKSMYIFVVNPKLEICNVRTICSCTCSYV